MLVPRRMPQTRLSLISRNQEVMNTRVDLIATGSSHSESKGEPTRSALKPRSRTTFTPSLTSRSVTRSKRKLQGQTPEFSGEEYESDVDDGEEFVFDPRIMKINVKTPPPKGPHKVYRVE